MAATRGRRVALWAGGATLVAVTSAAFALRERIVEESYIWRLESDSAESRCAAIRWIGRQGSRRAVAAWASHTLEMTPGLLLAVGLEGLEWSEVFGDEPGWLRYEEEKEANTEATRSLKARWSSSEMAACLLRMRDTTAGSRRVGVMAAVFFLCAPERGGFQDAVGAGERTASVRMLIDALSDQDPWVRAGAAAGLALAEPSDAVVAALRGLLTDQDPRVSDAATRALKQIESSSHAHPSR